MNNFISKISKITIFSHFILLFLWLRTYVYSESTNSNDWIGFEDNNHSGLQSMVNFDDHSVIQSLQSNEFVMDKLEYQDELAKQFEANKIFDNSKTLNEITTKLQSISSINPDESGKKIFKNQLSQMMTFKVEENDRHIDSDIEVLVTISLPFSTFEGHTIDYFIISTPPLYTLPLGERVCRSVGFMKDFSHIEENKEIRIKCITITANNLLYFVIQTQTETPISAPGTHMFILKVRTPAETHKVYNDPKNFWWLAKIRFSSGHYITKVFENSRLLQKAECQWSPWRRETGCSSTCNGGIEIWRRSLLSGKDEEFCGGVYQSRECATNKCNISCQLGMWEKLIDCTTECDASLNNGKKVEVRRVIMLNSGKGLHCSEIYPWNEETQTGWNPSLGMVVRYSECEPKYQKSCNEQIGCRVEKENLRTIPSNYPWGPCPFPCGGFGNITSLVQVAHGIPKWVGEKLFPETFEFPCKSNKKPIIEHIACNTRPCEDCMIYLENSELNTTTNVWIFFHLFQEADEIRFTLPKGFSFPVYNEINLSLTKYDNNKDVNISNNKPWTLLDSIKLAIDYKGNRKEEVINNNNNVNVTSKDCHIIAASFGSIKSCNILSSSKDNSTIFTEALLSLDSTVEATKSNFNEGNKNQKPNWFIIPINIQSAEGLLLPNGIPNKEQFKLHTRGSNSLKEPEELICNLQTKISLPQPCLINVSPVRNSDCENCTKRNIYDIEVYRLFIPEKNGGACVVPIGDRIPEIKTKISCINVCPKGKQYTMGTIKDLTKIGFKFNNEKKKKDNIF
ncbi:hypothetical protein ACR3K2_28260 [Cryptosporidium serpentis]